MRNHTLLAATGANVVVVSSDSGRTWKEKNVNRNLQITGVAFFTDSDLWVVGYQGKVFHSSDFGNTWLRKPVPSGQTSLSDVFAFDEMNAWICGDSGVVLRSVDGGSNWTRADIAGYPQLKKIWFVSATYGFAAGNNGKLYRSVNGGLTWNQISVGITGQNNLTSMFFLTPALGWIASDQGVVFRTTNSGVSWTKYSPGSTNFPLINSLYFTTPSKGWAAAWNSTIPIKTTDGGVTWSSITSGSGWNWAISPNALAMPDSTHAIVVGRSGFIGRYLVNNPGYSDTICISTENSISELSFPNGEFGISTGGNLENLLSLDSGKTWIRKTNNFVYPHFSIHFQTPAKGWCVGFTNQAFRTLDSGKTWTFMVPAPQLANQQLFKVRFWNETDGLVTGMQGVISKTTDGGVNWNVVHSNGTTYMTSLDLTNDSVATVGGYGGLLKRSTDRGNTWNTLNSGTTANIKKVRFTNPNQGWILLYDGIFRRTTNHGMEWLAYPVPDNALVHDLYAADSLLVILTTKNGQILKTLEGGQSWQLILDDSLRQPFSVHCKDPDHCWYYSGGTVFRQTCEVFTQVKQPEPQHILSDESVQLFPNPSRESIQVKGNPNFRNYEVYNLQGVLLLKGEMTHEIDIRSLKKGLYRVRLQNEKETKTMSLMKD